MSEKERRFWFKAVHKGGGSGAHVISARTIGRARASMGRMSSEYIFSDLMWCELCDLVGCAMVTVEANSTLAEGHLLFDWHGKVISIEVAD